MEVFSSCHHCCCSGEWRREVTDHLAGRDHVEGQQDAHMHCSPWILTWILSLQMHSGFGLQIEGASFVRGFMVKTSLETLQKQRPSWPWSDSFWSLLHRSGYWPVACAAGGWIKELFPSSKGMLKWTEKGFGCSCKESCIFIKVLSFISQCLSLPMEGDRSWERERWEAQSPAPWPKDTAEPRKDCSGSRRYPNPLVSLSPTPSPRAKLFQPPWRGHRYCSGVRGPVLGALPVLVYSSPAQTWCLLSPFS